LHAWLAVAVLPLTVRSALAVIEKAPALKDVLADAQYIFTVKVDTLDPDKPSVVLLADEDLKNKAPFRRLPVNLKGDADAEKNKHTPQLLKRLAPKLPLVVFVMSRGKQYVAFAYTNGTWFSMRGAKDGDAVRWAFTHCEPYLRGTFKGTTKELKQVVLDGLAGKKEPPEPNRKEKPGLGPEVKADEDKEIRRGGEKENHPTPTSPEHERRSHSISLTNSGPMFAVIPSVLVGGPLAVLAMLFPTVFGGWKRWLALISVAGGISTLYFGQWLFGSVLAGTWLGSAAALWVGMAVITLSGTLWAWHRHAVRVRSGEAVTNPSRVEAICLLVLSIVGAGLVIYARSSGQSLLAPSWLPVIVFCVGAWIATFYVVVARRSGRTTPALASEGVMLSAMAFANIALGAAIQPRAVDLAGGAEFGEARQGADTHTISSGRLVWTFRAPNTGSLAGSPLVAGDRIYVGLSQGGFAPYGEVHCLDRRTGKSIWHFNDDQEMKAVSLSSPCLADGRLYIGEGYHQDSNCKLYCLSAETGAKLWEFATASHTESSPCVANGKVYCGAGDDGLYCLDAITGKEVWHFPGFHIDASPVVANGRVFVGSGIGDVYKDTALFCLDAESGKLRWRLPMELPSWPAPAVQGQHVYFGIGNGRFNESEARPAGALVCVEAETGNEVWRYTVGDGVLARPVVEGRFVYFGARDGNLYCLERGEGRLAWKHALGGPIVAAPLVARCNFCGTRTSVFAVSGDNNGYARLVCLGANTGSVSWSADIATLAQASVELWSSPALTGPNEAAGEGRRIYVGASINGTARTAALYCFEDHIESDAEPARHAD
jgi:outer membrane protein assembly factor BamB